MATVGKQWVWLLGGGSQQVPMLEEIKRRGYKVLVTDLSPNCACRYLADRFEPIDIYNCQDNLTFAREIIKTKYQPVAVLTVATDAGIEVSAVAEYFGLPAAPLQVAKQVRNKAMMRGLLKDLSPEFQAGVTMAHFNDWDIWPCVVKAADNSGSKGFSVVRSRGELQPALVKARNNNRYGINTVLVEEYIQKKDFLPEFTDWDTSEAAVEGFVVDGEWIQVNGALRLFHRGLDGIEAGHFNPLCLDKETTDKLNQAAQLLGVTCGPLKFDLMYTESGWQILECATRLSGGYDHAYTAVIGPGKDITGAMLDFALTGRPDLLKVQPTQDHHACCYAPILKPGRLTSWVIPEEARRIAVHIFTNDKAGEIRPLESNADRALFLICEGGSRQEALEKCLQVAATVKPLYEEK